jgi:hypothetical protein
MSSTRPMQIQSLRKIRSRSRAKISGDRYQEEGSVASSIMEELSSS